MMGVRNLGWAMVVILAGCLPLSAQQSNGPVNYFYDNLGRLVRVVDVSGNVATYNYDAVGNILSITRSTISGLNILNFTPGQGSTGQTVTIQGQGFSATPSSNTVQFNGTAAVVSAATTTSLTVTVPTGATTGPISVKVGTVTTTSSTNFTIVPVTLVSLQVSPGSTSLIVGIVSQTTQQLAAVATYSNGTQQDVTSSATFNSSNSSVALLIGAGLFERVSTGVATITASYNGVVGYAYIKVLSLTSLSLSPQSPTIPFGTTLQFKATGSFSDGSNQDVTALANWSSSQALVASISNTTGSQGLADGLSIGSTTISATCAGPSASTALSVTQGTPSSLVISPADLSIPKAVHQTFTATGMFPDGSARSETASVTWNSSNSAVATISNAAGTQGLANDVGIGNTTITATLGSVASSTNLTLTAPVPASLSVSPATLALQPGSTGQLTATLNLTDDTTQDVTHTATWNSSATSVATVSNASGTQGLVTAVAVGSTAVSATSGSLSGSSTVFVNNNSSASYPRFLYVSDGGGSIFIYSVNSQTGQLRANGSVPVSNQSGNLALDPSQSYLYFSAPAVGGNFFAFSVNPTNGALTPVSGSPYTAGTSLGPVVTEPSDRFVYVGDPSSNSIFGFSIGAGGALTALPGSPYPAGGAPNALLAHPSGKFLFATDATQNAVGSVYGYSIDPNSGALTQISGSPFEVAYNPVAMAQDPAGKYLYVSNSGQTLTSRILRPNWRDDVETTVARPSRDLRRSTSTNLLASLYRNESPFPVVDGETDDLGHFPFGRLFFQIGVTTSPAISAFTVDPNAGTLTPLSSSPFTVSTGPKALAVDTTGQYLYGPTTSSVLAFSISSTDGSLTPLSTSPLSLSIGPLVFDPSGQFAYAQSGNGLQEMSTNSGTGTLAAVPGGNPVGGSSIVVTKGSAPISYVPQFAYVVNTGSSQGNISGYSINASTGALTSLLESPFAEGFNPVFATADMFGQSLYVANTCSDPTCTAGNGSVSGYSIDRGSGTLTAAVGSPFSAGVAPVSVALQPPGVSAQSSIEYAYVALQNGEFFEYTVNPATGVLTTFPGSPANTTTNGLVATAIDPTESILYVIAPCSTCGGYALYGFDLFLNNGQLIFQPPTISASVGTNARAIGVDPGGRSVLVTDAASNSVYVFSTASYTQVPGSPFATDGNPSAVALDPVGQFVYIANQSTNDVSAYTMDPATGSLTPISGSPFPVGTGPVSLTVDFSGKFLYVTNQGDGTVSAFSITPGSGILTPLAGSPFPAGVAPISVITTGKVE